MDWTGRGNLTLFLDAIAEAGLFANLRIGPYVCAEWDYGGIPTWLAYKPDMRFRAYNDAWRSAVEGWFKTVIAQTRSYFADQGGPIVLAQVENELSGADQRYVDWNGDLAAESFNVNVPWIMCNGAVGQQHHQHVQWQRLCRLSREQWTESGRILIDQPAHVDGERGLVRGLGRQTPIPKASTATARRKDVSVHGGTLVRSRWFAT